MFLILNRPLLCIPSSLRAFFITSCFSPHTTGLNHLIWSFLVHMFCTAHLSLLVSSFHQYLSKVSTPSIPAFSSPFSWVFFHPSGGSGLNTMHQYRSHYSLVNLMYCSCTSQQLTTSQARRCTTGTQTSVRTCCPYETLSSRGNNHAKCLSSVTLSSKVCPLSSTFASLLLCNVLLVTLATVLTIAACAILYLSSSFVQMSYLVLMKSSDKLLR